MERPSLLWAEGQRGSTRDGGPAMKASSLKPVRCAIYTRVSTEHGLDQEFNSLDAQYDAASAYIKSQAHAGLDPDPLSLRRWRILRRINRSARPAATAGRHPRPED